MGTHLTSHRITSHLTTLPSALASLKMMRNTERRSRKMSDDECIEAFNKEVRNKVAPEVDWLLLTYI